MRKISIIPAFLAVLLAFAACDIPDDTSTISVTSVYLNFTVWGSRVGDTETFTATIMPPNATNKNVIWSSDDDAVAIVSTTGVVTLIGAGTTTITVTTVDGGKYASCRVDAIPIYITGISLNKKSASLVVGGTETLYAIIEPDNANKNVTWKSSNTAVATVSEAGVVTAVSAGTATITATADGGRTANCTVTVNNAAVSVIGVSLNKSSVGLLVGAIETLTATITPTNATNKNITWISSNTAVATVSTTGVVTAVSAGTATITVTTVDGNKTANCTVTVSPIAVSSVSLNKTSTSLLVGGTEELTAVITPSTATNQNITWKSSNTAVATVSTTGVVTAVSAGTATITVTTVDGNKTASCTVTVSNIAVPVTGVSLDKTTTGLVVGEYEELTAIITPTTATNQNISWKSSNTTVAEVSAGGVVTAKNVGTSTITVTTNDGSKTASCIVTVNPKVITLTVDAISAQTYTGSAITPNIVVRDGSTALTLSTHYTRVYTNNTNAGTATVTISGAGNYAGSSGSVTFTINPKVIAFTVDTIPNQTYTGNAITPTVVVKDGSTTLSLTTHYTATYTNNTNVGTATVTVSGAGNYAGSSGSRDFIIQLPSLTGSVSITGTTQVGQTLTANTASLNGSGDISYQWKRGTTNIGTNSSTYTLQSADVGYTITVTVTRSGNSGSVSSSATAAITLPVLTGTVSISGTVQVGQTLTANTANLLGSGTFSYQWNRGGTAISGATSGTYTVQSADVDNTISVTVTRSGNSGSVTSDTVSVVTVLPFSKTIEGSITATNTKNRYMITLAQQGTITLSLTSPGGTTALPNNGADVKWYNASNTLISGGTSSGFSFPYTETKNNFAVGTYYIEIIKRGSNANDGNTGKYNIRADYYKDEVEPNNTTSNAQLLVPGLTVSASISSSDTVDMFKYVLTEPGRLTVNATKDTLQYTYVRWYDVDGTRIRSDSVLNNSWPFNQYMDLEAGTYYIGVEQNTSYGGNTGTYNLRADFTAAGNNETEPNNTRQNAQSLTSGQTVKGFISYKDDIDLYKVVLTQSSRVAVNVTKDSVLSIYAICVRWYEADGTRIRNDSVLSWPYDQYMDFEAGTYYIGIEQNTSYGSNTGPYILYADFIAAGNNEATATTEPSNNTRQTAQSLTSGQTVKGFISYQDDIDMYKVVLTQSKRVTVNVTKDSVLSIYAICVRWYEADGTRIRNDSVLSWPYDKYMDLAAGTYYIGIEQNTSYGSNTGPYNLKVTW